MLCIVIVNAVIIIYDDVHKYTHLGLLWVVSMLWFYDHCIVVSIQYEDGKVDDEK